MPRLAGGPRRAILAALALAALAGGAGALEARPLEWVPDAAGEAYLDAIRWSRVDAEMTYFDPAAPPPDLGGRVEAPETMTEEERERAAEMNRWVVIAIAAAALLAVLAVLARHGGLNGISFARPPMEARRGEAPAPAGAEAAPAARSVADIVAIADRREALIRLFNAALAAAAQATGVRLGRSQTARDALRALPPRWPHLPALRDIGRAAELAHFGGRPVTEEGFREALTKARPILGERA